MVLLTVTVAPSPAPGAGTVTGSHTYSTPGVYTVKLTVSGNTGASGQSSLANVTVVASSGAFVTGSGWVNCPAAMPGCGTTPPAGGKANVAFNIRPSREIKGTATGAVTFQFPAASITFKATQFMTPLAIFGNKATVKGKGTVNGSGSYSFVLSVIDNGDSGDQVRLRYVRVG